jgi:hypothetical protein
MMLRSVPHSEVWRAIGFDGAGRAALVDDPLYLSWPSACRKVRRDAGSIGVVGPQSARRIREVWCAPA